VRHFVDEPRLRDTSVLNPHSATDSVYRLLRAKDGPGSDGTLTLAEARAASRGDGGRRTVPPAADVMQQAVIENLERSETIPMGGHGGRLLRATFPTRIRMARFSGSPECWPSAVRTPVEYDHFRARTIWV
jgi:hypothetical protein